MPEAIHYCDACGRLVRPSEFAEGKAIIVGTETLCGECLAKLPPDRQRELRAARKTPAPASTPSSRKHTHHSTSTRHAHVSRRQATGKRGLNLGASHLPHLENLGERRTDAACALSGHALAGAGLLKLLLKKTHHTILPLM